MGQLSRLCMSNSLYSFLDGRDAKTMVILCGRLVHIFHSKFEEYIPTASQILNHLIQLQSTLLTIYESNSHLYLSELIGSLFATINLFINWIVEFRKWLMANKTEQLGTIDSLLVYLIDICIVSSHKQARLKMITVQNKDISSSATALLKSISYSLRFPLLRINTVKEYLQSFHQKAFSDTATKCNAYYSVTYMFTIVDQAPQLSEHQVSDRMALCIGFYDSLCDPLIEELFKMSNNLNYGNLVLFKV